MLREGSLLGRELKKPRKKPSGKRKKIRKLTWLILFRKGMSMLMR